MACPARRRQPLPLRLAAALLLCAVLIAPGCALVESAAEVTIGKGQLPAVDLSFELPKVDDLLAGGLPSEVAGQPATGVPTSLEATTLGHVQGLLGLTGACRLDHPMPEADSAEDKTLSDVRVDIVTCPEGGWCAAWCEGNSGLMLRFGAEMTFIDDEQAANVRKQLTAEVGDAIAQIRFRFKNLSLRAGDRDAAETLKLVERFDIELLDLAGGKSQLLQRHHLETLQDGETMRLELDPNSGVTEHIRGLLEQGKGIRLRIRATLVVDQGDLIAWQVSGTRLDVSLQPEIVLSTVSLAKGFL